MSDMLHMLYPFIVLCCGGMVCVVMGVAKSENVRRRICIVAMLTILLSLAVTFIEYNHLGAGFISEEKSLHLSAGGFFASVISQVVGILLLLISWEPRYHSDRGYDGSGRGISVTGEYFGMLLFSLSGMVLVTLANNLIVLFLALELVSIPTYILVTLSRPQGQAKEAGLKYFFLGSMAAALTVYGFSFLYGVAGSCDFDVIRESLRSGLAEHPFYILALLLAVAGLCFKIAALPFHFYVADVYQGAASPVTALLAFMPKLAGLYSLLIVLSLTGGPLWSSENLVGQTTGWMLWILAAGTMTVGNVLAMVQSNVKRILAYSSVAHSGYMMLVLVVASEGAGGMSAMLFYMCVYAIATLGIFGVLGLMERDGDEVQELKDLSGLSRKHPAMAAALAICTFSLIGMPLTGGFVGKFYVFSSLVGQPEIPYREVLLVIALINAAVGAYYYLRIIGACYLEEGEFTAKLHNLRPVQASGIALASILTIILGIVPGVLIKPMDTEVNGPREIAVAIETDASTEMAGAVPPE
ncbi:MAG: NADH-quinone oxidoreductase subunit N [Planctomycetes bacterium]|nr:NADH-quinone oxidoreductase subunit N [Planctomycetota bacterium]